VFLEIHYGAPQNSSKKNVDTEVWMLLVVLFQPLSMRFLKIESFFFCVISRSFCVSWRTKNWSNPSVLKENLKLKMIGLLVIYMWWDWKLNYPQESLVKACVCSCLSFILIIRFDVQLHVYSFYISLANTANFRILIVFIV